MKLRYVGAVVSLVASSVALAGGPAPPSAPLALKVTFHQNVFPLLKRSCISCHGGERPKAGLSMETLEGLQAGGKRGPPIVPGKASESLLFLLVSGERKPRMPPKKEDALSGEEIETLRLWIEGGARAGDPLPVEAPYSRPLLPPVYPRPPVVPALLYSADGGLLFVAGYKEILVHEGEPSGKGESLRARMVGEAERVNALALSPDGKLLAAAGGSPAQFGEVQIWEAASGKLLRFLRLGRDTFFAIAFSPDGRRIAFGGADRSAHVHEVATGKELCAAEVHSDWIFGMVFSADGSRIVSGGRDKTLKVWESADGKLLSTLSTFGEPVVSVAARPGSAMVLSSGEGKTPVLFDSRELKELRKFEAAPGAILASAFSADGKLFAVGGAWDEVRVYKADDGAREATLKGNTEWIYALAFRPDGKRVAAAGYEGLVRIYELKEGKQVRSFVCAPIQPGAED